MRNKKQRGFTLIEMLVVVLIIGILATIVVVAINGGRQKANAAKAVGDIKAVKDALDMANAEGCRTVEITSPGTISGKATAGCQMDKTFLVTPIHNVAGTGITYAGFAASATFSTSGYSLTATGFNPDAVYTCTPAGCSCSTVGGCYASD